MQSMFNNIHSVTINGGVFSQHNNPTASSSLEAFERLEKALAPGAFHNSGERFDPPKCHPRTRLAVTERIRNWILRKESTNSFVMWLNGPAGAGKSAIAQRIAELCYESELLASFFFCGSDPRRNHPNSLFPTIAYQIACAIPPTRSLIEQEISRDPLIFTRNLEAQMIALVVKPLQPLVVSGYFFDPISSPSLIIIDGLDEVVDRQAQTKILEAVSNLLGRHRLPLIFLIASRPEQEIVHAFSTQPLSELSIRLTLDDRYHPDDDIRLFLDESFSQIKAEHPRRNLIPTSWPSATVMDKIVLKASGQFIYAATVIRFIKSLRHRPVDRLEIILGLRPVQSDMPFAELDALYMHILSALEDPDRTLLIVGFILVKAYNDLTLAMLPFIEKFLGLDADMALYAYYTRHLEISSSIPYGSGIFAIDRKAIHTIIASRCLLRLNLASNGDPLAEDWSDGTLQYALKAHQHHLLKSNLSPELMVHLQALSFKCLLENTILHSSAYGTTEDLRWNKVIFDTWRSMFDMIYALQKLGLEQSKYYSLRRHLFDQVIQREFDIQYAENPSLPFMLCLRLECNELDSHFSQFFLESRYMPALIKVTDQNVVVRRDRRPDTLGSDTILNSFLFGGNSELPAFLNDASRAGKYLVNAETYAIASLSCLEYLCRSHIAVSVKLQDTHRHLERRRNSPWIWRQHKYLWLSKGLQRFSKHTLATSYRATANMHCIWSQFPQKFYRRFQVQQEYMGATYLSLRFLPKALRRAAKSDELVAFASAEKPFSELALKFPANTRICKGAIAAYLVRVQQDSGTQPCATSGS